jgi:endoglycosylceramidase
VVLHGVNVVYKVDPYIPSSDAFNPELSLTDDEIASLVDWGFNFVRLGVMWEAVERSPGTYNQTYLDQVDSLITRLGQKGIYTLIDAH